MRCHCNRTKCIWFWVILTFLGVALIASGTYFSVTSCSAANIIQMDCLMPLSICGAGVLVFILVGFGCSCLPARSEKESEEEKKEEWEEYIESAKLEHGNGIRRVKTNETKNQESFRSHGEPPKRRGGKRKFDDSARSHTESDGTKKDIRTSEGFLREYIDLILEEAKMDPKVIQDTADFFAELAKRVK